MYTLIKCFDEAEMKESKTSFDVIFRRHCLFMKQMLIEVYFNYDIVLLSNRGYNCI